MGGIEPGFNLFVWGGIELTSSVLHIFIDTKENLYDITAVIS